MVPPENDVCYSHCELAFLRCAMNKAPGGFANHGKGSHRAVGGSFSCHTLGLNELLSIQQAKVKE